MSASLAEAARIKTNYLTPLRQFEYKRKSGVSVDMAVARNVLFNLCCEQRDTWVARPAKIAPFVVMEFTSMTWTD